MPPERRKPVAKRAVPAKRNADQERLPEEHVSSQAQTSNAEQNGRAKKAPRLKRSQGSATAGPSRQRATITDEEYARLEAEMLAMEQQIIENKTTALLETRRLVEEDARIYLQDRKNAPRFQLKRQGLELFKHHRRLSQLRSEGDWQAYYGSDYKEQLANIANDIVLATNPDAVETCLICKEEFDIQDAVRRCKKKGLVVRCGHSYCNDCIQTSLRLKLTSFARCFPLECYSPNCNHPMPEEWLKQLLGQEYAEAFDRKQFVDTTEKKLYCPVNTCNHLMSLDKHTSESPRIRECSACRTAICTRCKVEEHKGMDCKEYLAVPHAERFPEDRGMFRLIAYKKMRRCPGCSYYIEICDGSNRIACPCGTVFCFQCANPWNKQYNRCSTGECLYLMNQTPLAARYRRKLEPLTLTMLSIASKREKYRRRRRCPRTRNRKIVMNLREILHQAVLGRRPISPWMFSNIQINRCGYCFRTYKNIDDLESHLNHCVQHEVYFCCGQLYRTLQGKWLHKRKKRCLPMPFGYKRPNMDDLDLCGAFQRRVSGQANMSRWLFLGLKALYCPYCKEEFDSLRALEDHIKTTTRHRVYYCCGKLYKNIESSRMHQQSVTCPMYQVSNSKLGGPLTFRAAIVGVEKTADQLEDVEMAEAELIKNAPMPRRNAGRVDAEYDAQLDEDFEEGEVLMDGTTCGP